MSRTTPFVKRMRNQGGTIYTFNSAVEDIGLNINEKNNVVKISHFALLEIPRINYDASISTNNRFNVDAIPGAFLYSQDPAIKDGRVLIAESFQNYALNFESNLLNDPDYDATLTRTVSERVFWKWLKETGAIRWQPDVSSGYWTEEAETDVDGVTGYKSVVKYVGLVSAGNVRSDSFGTYNETYILVPTSHGQVEAHFEQTEDTNYYHGMEIGNLYQEILGRENYLKPHPDGLSYSGYYDFMTDPSSLTNPSFSVYWESLYYDVNTSLWTPGSWFTADERTPISTHNAYLTDSNNYLAPGGILNVDIQYNNNAGETRIFRRSNVDCMGLIWDLNKLKSIYGDSALTFDKMAMQYAVNDTYNFNAALIYYSIYNSVQDTVLATNLLGILFLDSPSGSTENIGFGGIIIPSLEKIQSGPGGFGTSYALRLNIKTDNMLDDTAAAITDAATSDQLYAQDWNEAFYQLGKAVNILTQNNSVLSYISTQYEAMQSTQNQMLNDLQQVQNELNDLTQEVKGTENTIPLFSSGTDPLIDSSIYMENGNIGLFNNHPTWPVQIDASLKAKDIYIEKAIRDVSGNILLNYGSPLQFGDPSNFRGMTFYTGNATPAIYIDTSNNVIIPALGNFLKESSLGTSFIWTGGIVDVSGGSGSGWKDASINQLWTYDYVQDASIIGVQSAIALTQAAYIPNASLGTSFKWTGGILDVSVSGGGATVGYVDIQDGKRDVSIAWLNSNKIGSSDLAPYATTYSVGVALRPYATNASIGTAAFAKQTDLNGKLDKAGGTISGDLAVTGNTNLGERHAMAIGTSDITCPVSESDMDNMSVTITPKGTKLFIMFSAPFHTNIIARGATLYINVAGSDVRSCRFEIYQQVMNVSFQHIAGISPIITPGVPITIKIRWSGDTAIHQGDAYANTERILTVIDLY